MSEAPNWISAVATVIGSIGTVGALIATYRLLRREADRDAITAQDRQGRQAEESARQARLISGWHSTRYDVTEEVYEHGAFIRNASELPIYDVQVFWRRVMTDDQTFEAAWANVWIYHIEIPVLPPAKEPLYQEMWAPNYSFFNLLEREGYPKLAVEIEFRDAAGRCWRRDHGGDLSAVTETKRPDRRRWAPVQARRPRPVGVLGG
ncbi:hypothetical protein [Catellatospora sp. TT07R-123]|uniref:hypothetical protein n=1 Tax=Catellatospora sp. TT07R-123 TaxID=2733863 RepID=UPI001FD5FD2E|nr:hypothetical protein [Catellatospora sp. TT07R-123]